MRNDWRGFGESNMTTSVPIVKHCVFRCEHCGEWFIFLFGKPRIDPRSVCQKSTKEEITAIILAGGTKITSVCDECMKDDGGGE